MAKTTSSIIDEARAKGPERLAAIRSRQRLVQARVIQANHKGPYTSRAPAKSRSGDLQASLTVPKSPRNQESGESTEEAQKCGPRNDLF